MGAQATKENLYYAINAQNEDWITRILEKRPEFINEPITSDGRSNCITRAAYCGYPRIILHLIKYGADLNRTGSSGITGLMWAAARGHLDCCKILVEFGSNIEQTGPFSLNALDFTALYGSYNTGYYLVSRGLRPTREAEDYAQITEINPGRYVDYGGFLMSLECKIPPEVAPAFTNPPVKKIIPFVDPVTDPRETWGNWVKRVVDFEEPPLVERNELPRELQPQNRPIGRMWTFLGAENAPPEDYIEGETGKQDQDMMPSQESISARDVELVKNKTIGFEGTWSEFDFRYKYEMVPKPQRTVLKLLYNDVIVEVFKSIDEIEKAKKDPNHEGQLREIITTGSFQITGLTEIAADDDPSSVRVVAGDSKGNIFLLDASRKVVSVRLEAFPGKRIQSISTATVDYIEGKVMIIAVCAQGSSQVQIYLGNVMENQVIWYYTVQVRQTDGNDDPPYALKLSQDGAFLAITKLSGTIDVYRLPYLPTPTVHTQERAGMKELRSSAGQPVTSPVGSQSSSRAGKINLIGI